jgi:hypothetical protein
LVCGTEVVVVVVVAAAAEFVMILFLSFVCLLFLYVLCFPPPSFAGCCHLCRRRQESLYLPLLLTYPCQQPASFENFNCEQLIMFSSITTLPFGDCCSRWLAGWLSSCFFALVVVVPMTE